MAIIKQYHKDTDTTYVYDSASYWDAEKGQSRSKRKLLGKLDPQTGEIIPTGQRGRKKKERPAEDPVQVEARVAAASAGYLEKIQQQGKYGSLFHGLFSFQMDTLYVAIFVPNFRLFCDCLSKKQGVLRR